MNRVTTARRALADALTTTSVKAFDNLPQQINARRAIGLTPAVDYLTSAPDFGADVQVRLYAWALVKPVNDRADEEALDDLILNLLTGLPAPWSATECDEPDVLAYGDWAMYGARLTLTATL